MKFLATKKQYIVALLTVILNALVFQCAAGSGNAADSLNKAAAKQIHSDLPEALNLALSARQIATDVRDTRNVITAACVISKVWGNTSRCREAIKLLDDLKLAIKDLKDPASSVILFSSLGDCWSYFGKYDSARAYHEQALNVAVTHRLVIETAKENLALGKLCINSGNLQKALQHYDRALPVLNRYGDKDGLAQAQHLLGEIFYAQRLYDKAAIYLNKTCKRFRELGYVWDEASVLLHEGNLYYMTVKDDSALACYTSALQKFTQVGDSSSMAICYSNLSRISLEKSNTVEAIAFAHKALNTIREGNYIVVEAGTYQQLGDIYGETGDYAKAVSYVEKALQAARKADHKVIVKDCYKSLSELYQAMKRPALAMNYLLAAYRLKDSIQPVAFSKQLADMEAAYEAQKKEAEIKLLKQQEQIHALKLERQTATLQKQRYLLTLLCLAVVVTIVATYLYIARRRLLEQMRKQHVIRETEEHERKRIAKDIHDELGSGLSKIRFLSELAHTQAAGAQQQQLSGALHSISDTSRGLVENMRDLIWAMNPENTTLDNLVARIREYSHDYLEEFPIDVIFDFPDDIPDRKISKEVNRNVSMIVKEVLQNIVKHASATRIQIRLTITPEFRLEIEDDGKGYDVTLAMEGNGLKNIEARSRALGARLQMVSQPGNGSHITLAFGLDSLA